MDRNQPAQILDRLVGVRHVENAVYCLVTTRSKYRRAEDTAGDREARQAATVFERRRASLMVSETAEMTK